MKSFRSVRVAVRFGSLPSQEQKERAMNAPVQATDDLLYAVEDGIARLTFNRPQARNALTFAMYERMAAICETINADRSIKAMILTGTGDKAFASGTDISQFRAFKTAQDALDYEARIDRVLGALEQVRVPTIAAIAGACTGGGAGIAACCDIRIGTAATRIGFPIARTLGNCLSMSNISRLVVAGRAGANQGSDFYGPADRGSRGACARPAQRSGAGCRDTAAARR